MMFVDPLHRKFVFIIATEQIVVIYISCQTRSLTCLLKTREVPEPGLLCLAIRDELGQNPNLSQPRVTIVKLKVANY